MANVNLYQRVEYTVGDDTYVIGSLTTPVTVAASNNEPFKQVFPVANGASAVVWNTSTTSDFDFLAISSDQTVRVALKVDTDYHRFTLAPDVAFILGDDDSEKGGSAAFDGTHDTVDEIRVENNSGTAANVTVFVAT